MSVTTPNASDLALVLETRAAMGDRPVIVVLELSNPTVVARLEAAASALLVSFSVQDQAILDILAGAAEPSGLLPLQMPASMRTVEEQHEDTPLDMEPHVDTEGHAYDFAFGLDWSGVIQDARTERYGQPVRAAAGAR